MSNRRYTSQFSYSFERQPVRLMGAFAQDGSAGAASTATIDAIVFTAQKYGVAGDNISIEAVDPGAPDVALSVQVAGDAILVTLETDNLGAIVTTRADLATAINASAGAFELVSASSVSATVVTPFAATNLAGGADTTLNSNAPISTMQLEQVGVGKYRIQLSDFFPNLLHANVFLKKSTPAVAICQIESVDIAYGGKKRIVFNVLDAAGAGLNLASGDIAYINLDLRNSANPN